MSTSTQKGAANTLESSIVGTFVCTASCKAADDAFRLMMIGSSAVGGLALLIIGESGVGKTTLLDAFYRGLEPVRTAEGWIRPCLRIQIPTAPTAISLFEALLNGL